jgi:hypothetical protein
LAGGFELRLVLGIQRNLGARPAWENGEKMKRIGVTVDDETHARFKAACALNLVNMEEVLKRAVEEYIADGDDDVGKD